MLSNYPDGLSDYSIGVPWNDPVIPEKEFEITVCQSLSRTDSVYTDDYTPCCDEDCEDGIGYHDEWADTSDTNWKEVAEENGIYTPLQLIQILEKYVEKDFEETKAAYEADNKSRTLLQKFNRLKILLEQCKGWEEDEYEVVLNG